MNFIFLLQGVPNKKDLQVGGSSVERFIGLLEAA